MADYQEIYPWLTKSLFEKILRDDRANDRICVTDLVIKSALGSGENYCSQMLRVKVCFKDESSGVVAEFPFIVKAQLTTNETAGDVVNELGMFQKEIVNLEMVIPACQMLLQSIGDTTVLAPKCYSSSVEDSYLVLEDLSTKGFVNLNRQLGLRVHDYRFVLNAAAKWHATTAVLLENNPSMFEIFTTPSIVKTNKTWRNAFENTSKAVADACREQPRFQHLVKKLESGHSTLYDRVCDAVVFDADNFNVLGHGDMWSNNIMFTRDAKTGNSTGAILVDFQLGNITSPVLDLIYALFSSSHEDITAVDWEEMIQFYHEKLSGCLKSLGYTRRIPTLTDLHVEMLKKGIFGAYFGIFVLAVRSLPSDAGADMSKFLGDKKEDRAFRKEAMMKPAIRKSFEFLVSYCDRKGFFDN